MAAEPIFILSFSQTQSYLEADSKGVFMSIAWIMGGFFVLITLIFFALAFFLPEWVGITGKKARQTMKEQKGDSQTEPEPPSQI